MKIALILRGLSKCAKYLHGRKNVEIDYKSSVNNYHEMLFNNDDVDVFFHTYNTHSTHSTYSTYSSNSHVGTNQLEQSLISDYHPKKYIIQEPLQNSLTHNHVMKAKSMFNSIISAIDCFTKYHIDHIDHIDHTQHMTYDYIIITRFDLRFHINFMDLIPSIVANKMNISHLCEEFPLIDDNFIVFTNVDQLNIYRNIVNNKYNLDNCNQYMLHHMYHELCGAMGKDNINFIIDGKYYVADSPLYDIVRDPNIHNNTIKTRKPDNQFILNNINLNRTSKHSNTDSTLMINSDKIMFRKNDKMAKFQWFGYDLEPTSDQLSVSFSIYFPNIVPKPNHDVGFKTHVPIQMINDWLINLTPHEWHNINFQINITKKKQLAIFIFDNAEANLEVWVRNIRIS